MNQNNQIWKIWFKQNLKKSHFKICKKIIKNNLKKNYRLIILQNQALKIL